MRRCVLVFATALVLGAAALAPNSFAEDATGVVIETPAALPWASLTQPYSETLSASGGAAPYRWALVSGSLPPGITLSSSGVVSGEPERAGTYYFTIAVQDATGAAASKSFGLVVVLPPTPTISVTGLSDSVSPAEQLPFDIGLSASYPLDITGTVTLTFDPDAVNPSDDPSVQFSTGGRTIDFLIPAGQLSAQWGAPPTLQTGTVAGKIRLRLAYSAAGVNLTPAIAPVRTITVSRSAPQIQSVEVIKGGSGFQVVVTGISTPREVIQAKFEFTTKLTGSYQTLTSTVNLKSAFEQWYKGEASQPFGSAFVYTQPFTVQGNLADIASVSVTLSNTNGSSSAVSADF
ncbi:MAG: Ig domain-containing protein [Bryobacteraceae bacterium]